MNGFNLISTANAILGSPKYSMEEKYWLTQELYKFYIEKEKRRKLAVEEFNKYIKENPLSL